MRLIDADALDREMYRKSFEVDDGRNVWNSGLWIRYKIYEEAIKDAPTVDAVPVIRCRDCIYWKRYCRVVDGVASNHVCGRKRELDGLMHRSKADDFCSWAMRRNDETD